MTQISLLWEVRAPHDRGAFWTHTGPDDTGPYTTRLRQVCRGVYAAFTEGEGMTVTPEQRRARRERQVQYNREHPTISVRTDSRQLARWREAATASGLSVSALVARAADNLNMAPEQEAYRRGYGTGEAQALADALFGVRCVGSWDAFWTQLNPELRRRVLEEYRTTYGQW